MIEPTPNISSTTFVSRGRGTRTPVNGFGDRRTATVLFPYVFFINELYYIKKQFCWQGEFFTFLIFLQFLSIPQFHCSKQNTL